MDNKVNKKDNTTKGFAILGMSAFGIGKLIGVCPTEKEALDKAKEIEDSNSWEHEGYSFVVWDVDLFGFSKLAK